MARVVALIDYGSGNLRSAEKALQWAAAGLAASPTIVATDDPAVIAGADAVVLPGVGAFQACRAALLARDGVVEAMETYNKIMTERRHVDRINDSWALAKCFVHEDDDKAAEIPRDSWRTYSETVVRLGTPN